MGGCLGSQGCVSSLFNVVSSSKIYRISSSVFVRGKLRATIAPNCVGARCERQQAKWGGTMLSHQSTESTEPQDPRDTIPAVVRRVFVLVTPIYDLEDETGNE